MRWIDTFGLCEAHHLRIADSLKAIDLVAWDSLHAGMGTAHGGGAITSSSCRKRYSPRVDITYRSAAAETPPRAHELERAACQL
jgi:hypothetical protein